MSKFAKNFFKYGILAPSALTYGATYYYFPELRGSQSELFKAFQRTCRVAIAGARMTQIYKSNDDLSISEKHRKASLILLDAFKKNAGLYIKFGQLVASLDVIVPPEYRENFEQLCHDCPESSFEKVKQILEAQYKQPLEEVFSEFDQKPIKSASIGQVHRATLKKTGEKVAVKVMHGWLKQESPGDLKMVDIFVKVGEKIFPEFQFQWFSDECSFNLNKELDFVQEVSNAEKCRQMLQNFKNIKVPKNYLDLCDEKIIVMEWVDGIPIMDVKQLRESNLNLPEISKTISNAFCHMIFKHGFVHADPHQGNFIINQNEKNETQVILLDHGLYLDLSEKTQLNYSKLWKGIITQNEKEMKKAAIELDAGDNFMLFVSMVTSRKYDDIVHQDMDMKNRLQSPDDLDHRKELANFGAQYHKEIIVLLHQMNRQLLLLFKINDFLRTIDNKLGAPINTFQITLNYCYQTIERFEKEQNVKKSIFRKIEEKFLKMYIETKLSIYKLLIQLRIMSPVI